MTYEYTGKVVHILDPEDISRYSKMFKRKQTIVCQEKENKCAFLLFDDRIEQFAMLGISIGDTVTITFSIKARLHRGEWYSNAYCLSITKKETYRKRNYEQTYSRSQSKKWFRECITRDDYKRKYRELCKKYHPDIATGDSKIMQEINIEYERYKK